MCSKFNSIQSKVQLQLNTYFIDCVSQSLYIRQQDEIKSNKPQRKIFFSKFFLKLMTSIYLIFLFTNFGLCLYHKLKITKASSLLSIYSLLMTTQSKVANLNLKQFLLDMLIGTKKKKFISAAILLIIGFLIHVKNIKSGTDQIKLKIKDKDGKKKGGKGNVDAVFISRIKKLLRIVIPSWKSVEVLDLALLTVFLVLRTFLTIYISSVNGKIVKAIIQKDLNLFIKRIVGLGLIAFPASFVNSFLEFLNKRLALNFRKRLTSYFHQRYLKGMIFYQLGNLDSRVTNPDQRLTADIQKWANSLSIIYSNFSKPTLDIILFSRKLSELVGWGGPGIVVLWYLLSGIVIKLISPPFGKLTAIQQKLQGDYRASQTDLVHHSEQVAFYRGNEWQKHRINTMFSNLIKHSQSIIHKKMYMGVFDSMLVKYGAVMCGYAVVGLPVFGPGSEEYLARVGSDPSAITRDYVRNSSLLINLAKAIGRLVISYKQIQHLAGFTTLVYEMKAVLEDLDRGQFVRTQVVGKEDEAKLNSINSMNKGKLEYSQDYIEFDHVPIISPNGDVLVGEMNFKVQKGMNTVITGPNGCGKSSLFRILSGLWHIAGGVVKRPHMEKLFYIPQRPYLPPGTLRDQIIYPHSQKLMQSRGITDDDLQKILRDVELAYIVDREGDFNSVNDWNDVLSGGQKQRMAMARLFYHKPLFAILDQCTSAVSVDVEAKLYNRAKALQITLFTVSHRQTLFKFHEYMIRFDGEGGYVMNKLENAH